MDLPSLFDALRQRDEAGARTVLRTCCDSVDAGRYRRNADGSASVDLDWAGLSLAGVPVGKGLLRRLNAIRGIYASKVEPPPGGAAAVVLRVTVTHEAL